MTQNTRIYYKIANKLDLVVICIITACDLVNDNMIEQLINDFKELVKSNNSDKNVLIIKSSNDINLFVRNVDELIIPLLIISSKTGKGFKNLEEIMLKLPCDLSLMNQNVLDKYKFSKNTIYKTLNFIEEELFIFDIHEHFTTINKKVVVAGFINKGKISLEDKCYLGPDKKGNYTAVEVKGLHSKKIPTKTAYKGDFITICLNSNLFYYLINNI